MIGYFLNKKRKCAKQTIGLLAPLFEKRCKRQWAEIYNLQLRMRLQICSKKKNVVSHRGMSVADIKTKSKAN